VHRFLLVACICVSTTACSERLHIGNVMGDGGSLDLAFGKDIYPDASGTVLTSASQLDILFLIDNSTGMRAVQTKFATHIPRFLSVLKSAPGGLPNVHIAVASSSLGAGAFANVPGCEPGTPGNMGGRFQHNPGSGLNEGKTFVTASADGSQNNFSGGLETVVASLVSLGPDGCGFEHTLAAARMALTKAANPSDPDNGGFLRPDAYLAVILLTDEDDCSAPEDSPLFDTNVSSIADNPPLGGLWSYRCNEFGHKCDQPMPHTADGLPTMMTGCVSAEAGANGEMSDAGVSPYHLISLSEFTTFFLIRKFDPHKVFVAIMAGPPMPYVIHARTAQTAGGTEQAPEVGHSCVASDGTYADPAVRLSALGLALGNRAIFESVCADDFSAPIERIGNAVLNMPR